MREVNNTSNSKNINFQGIQARKEAQPAPAMETREITDLGRMPAEVIGRSQVTKSSLEKDIAFLSNNIEKVEKLDKYCDQLMENGYSYEQACALTGVAAEEFYGM
ncbi:MAG: hypothetical protein E7Z93_01010 [Cyanobacteria bacterium SIG32]|nr:hypothetical protein [Cyanobacteria bacterium SIG32]